MESIKTSAKIDKLEKFVINDILLNKNNFSLKKKKNGYNTPKKYNEDLSLLSITPLSIVKKMKQISPDQKTNFTKKNLSSKFYFGLEKEICYENPKNLKKKKEMEITNLFYNKTDTKKKCDIKSFDILPIENLFFLKNNNFIFGNQIQKKNFSDNKKKNYFGGCNCRNSKCLKLYCDCLRKGNACKDCNCIGCENYEGSFLRNEKIKYIVKKNPNAFKPVISKNFEKNEIQHSKGCNCKKSGCMKNYCECKQFGIKCAEHCKCSGCKNC